MIKSQQNQSSDNRQVVNNNNSTRPSPQRSPIQNDVPVVSPPSTFQDPKVKKPSNQQDNRKLAQEQQRIPYDTPQANRQQSRPPNLPLNSNVGVRNADTLPKNYDTASRKPPSDQQNGQRRITPTENVPLRAPLYQQGGQQQSNPPSNIRPNGNKYGYDKPQVRPVRNPAPPQTYRRVNSNDKSPASDIAGVRPQQNPGPRYPGQNAPRQVLQSQNYQARPRHSGPHNQALVGTTANNPPAYKIRPSTEIQNQANTRPMRYINPSQQQDLRPRSAVNAGPQPRGNLNNGYSRPPTGQQHLGQRMPSTKPAQYQVNTKTLENVYYEKSTSSTIEKRAVSINHSQIEQQAPGKPQLSASRRDNPPSNAAVSKFCYYYTYSA